MDNMVSQNVDYETFFDFTQSVSQLLQFYKYLGSDRNVRFALDFAEIHSYLMPEKDFFVGIKSDSTLSRAIRHWYVARYLIDEPFEGKPTLLLPPYLMEFRHQMQLIMNFINSDDKYSNIKDTINKLKKSPAFSEKVDKYRINPSMDNLQRVINLANTITTIPFVLLIEIISDSLNKNIDDLNRALSKKHLVDSNEIFNIDMKGLVENSWTLAEEIKKVYQQKLKSSDSYSAFIDSLAINYVHIANTIVLRDNNLPVTILVSRSTVLPQIDTVIDLMSFSCPSTFVENKEEFPTLNALWKPETYLFYVMFENMGINSQEKIEELKQFSSILSNIDNKSFRQININKVLALSDERMIKLIDNFFFENSLSSKSQEQELITRKYSTNPILKQFRSGIDLLVSMITQEKTIVNKLKRSSKVLWNAIQLTNERISALRGLEEIKGLVPKINVVKIGSAVYCGFKISDLSFYTKLGDTNTKWVCLLENALQDENNERNVLKKMLDIVTESPTYSAKFNILVASLLICLERTDEAKRVLDDLLINLYKESDGDLYKEIQILLSVIIYLDQNAHVPEILKNIENLKSLLPEGETNEKSYVINRTNRIRIYKKRSARLYKLVGLLYYKLYRLHKVKYIEPMTIYFDKALVRTRELISKEKIDLSSDRLFYINSINNILYAYMELYVLEKKQDQLLKADIIALYNELIQHVNLLGSQTLIDYPEVEQTISYYKIIIQ